MSRSKTVGASLLLSACTLLLNARPAGAQEFTLHFRDGLVTLVARDVTVPTILTWWARLGNVTVVNGDKIDSTPVTLQLVDVPEREALAVLLRNVGGYILAARHEGDLQGVSVFDRILVLKPSDGPLRNQPPQVVAQFTPSQASQQNLEAPGVANESAEPMVLSSPPSSPAPAAAPFVFQGNGNRGPAGSPVGTSSGTARPGEMTVPPPPTRTSPGPPRPPGSR